MKSKISLRARALNILARQEISRSELARKLRFYVGENDDLEVLLNELAEHHWQSDERYTEMYVHSKSHLYGNLRLKQSLKQKGIDPALIQDYLPDKNAQVSNAITILHKKYRLPPTDLKEKHKQMHFLAYRGFNTDIIRTALQQAWANYSLPDDDDYC
jgi:regulatory protein